MNVLSKLPKLAGTKKKKDRVGRGYGSGSGGHTTGKGTKGQKSRTGANIPIGFEGGQVPLFKRLPELGGFSNPTTKMYSEVPLNRLNVFEDGAVVVPQDLVLKGIIKKIAKHGVKVLNNGKLYKKLTLKGFLATQTALLAIKAAGGDITEK